MSRFAIPSPQCHQSRPASKKTSCRKERSS